MPDASLIVLTADETMMSQYRGGIGTGFVVCMPQGIIPDWLFFPIFAPPVARRGGRAIFSDFGLRTIEASLIENGFRESEVAVVHPRDLDKMVGKETRICAFSGHDLLGINPPTSTFVDFARTGPPLNRVKFLGAIRKKCLENVTTVVGGKSAWQVADIPTMDRLGIDFVHLGEGEITAPRLFRSILKEEDVPRIVQGEDAPADRIPNIRGATIHGLVEISRGCGRGCAFCTPGMQKQRHKSIEHIIKDARVILDSGYKELILHSEDVLRYGTLKIEANEEAVKALVGNVTALDGLKGIGFSHIALATAFHSPSLVEEVSELALSTGQEYIGAQTGLETGSANLIAAHMSGKTLPASPERWREIVAHSLGMLGDNKWVLFCTLVVGLPGENEKDVLQTLEMIDDIKDTRTIIVPMGFVSMKGSRLSASESFTLEKMTPEHWRLFGECIRHDVTMARSLKSSFLAMNPFIRPFEEFIINRILNKGDRLAGVMLQGLPPRDYSPFDENYRDPVF